MKNTPSIKYNDKPLDEALLEVKKDLDNGEWNLYGDPIATVCRTSYGWPVSRKRLAYQIIAEYMNGKTRLECLELWESHNRQMSSWFVHMMAKTAIDTTTKAWAKEREENTESQFDLRNQIRKLRNWNTTLSIIDAVLALSLLFRCLFG